MFNGTFSTTGYIVPYLASRRENELALFKTVSWIVKLINRFTGADWREASTALLWSCDKRRMAVSGWIMRLSLSILVAIFQVTLG